MAVLRCVAAAVLLLASLPATALGVADVTRDGNGVITIIGDGGTDALTVSTVPGPRARHHERPRRPDELVGELRW